MYILSLRDFKDTENYKVQITLTSSVLRTRVYLCENELFIIKQWNVNY